MVAFRSAKAALERNFRGAKGDYFRSLTALAIRHFPLRSQAA
jgi:hypothetical protein